jgi:hypothetical protein
VLITKQWIKYVELSSVINLVTASLGFNYITIRRLNQVTLRNCLLIGKTNLYPQQTKAQDNDRRNHKEPSVNYMHSNSACYILTELKN